MEWKEGLRVVVSFVIDEKGILRDIEVLDSPHEVLTKAAINVLLSSPGWTPGRQRNFPVPFIYYLPVLFRLK